MVLFGRASFLTGVIAAQSQQRAEKVGASSKIGNVKKNNTRSKMKIYFFWRDFFLEFDLTLRANNSTLKTARPKKYHIFGILGT